MNTSLSMIHRNVWKKRSNIWWNQRLHQCLSLFTYLMKQNLSIAWSWTKKSLKTPALWTEFFECIHKKKGMLHVLCRYCHRSYAHPSKIGKDTANGNQNFNGPITSMSWHLKECNLYKAKQPQSQSSMTSFLSTNESQIGQNDLLSKVLRFFISANIPFNVAIFPGVNSNCSEATITSIL